MKTMIRGHMFDFRLVCKVKIKSYANFNIPNKPSKFYVWQVLICNIFANGWSKKNLHHRLLNIRSGVDTYFLSQGHSVSEV